ncbi:hypothetical protein DY000_02000876 [Brassica cretica]|uniref:Protein kish n=1 Tax=Brassica cretica TaxID=69181 RepID=A0ABQ7BY27_BRACR|nr:hypothetical protein DY000_02000876 [Brassica cretica]
MDPMNFSSRRCRTDRFEELLSASVIIRYNALFNFHSFLTVVLLVICTCTYLKMQFPAILEQKTGFRGFFWKAARIGERLSPWMSVGCFMMGVSIIFF